MLNLKQVACPEFRNQCEYRRFSVQECDSITEAFMLTRIEDWPLTLVHDLETVPNRFWVIQRILPAPTYAAVLGAGAN